MWHNCRQIKITNYKLIILVTVLLLSSYSCLNQYEKDAVGYYEVGSYERKDSLNTEKIDLPSSLILSDDKSFLLVIKDSTWKGKWKGGDNGDRTWITFYYKDGRSSDGDIGIGFINIWNPQSFNCPQLKTLVFKRINKK
jgi:hypothetical protein